MRGEAETATLSVVQWGPSFEILRGCYTRQRFVPHLHDTFALGAIETGASRIHYRGQMVRQSAGDVVIIPAGEVHTGEADSPAGWSYRMLYLPVDLMRELTPRECVAFDGPSIPDADLATRIMDLHATLECGADPLRGQSALADVLSVLHARHADRHCVAQSSAVAPDSAARLSRVRDYLEERFATPVTLRELSALAGISPFHLIRQFRRRYGLPPYMYLELVRVNHARTLLRMGESISRIAYATGFSDQSHLTRRFKRVVGVPPGQYARSYAADRARCAIRCATLDAAR